MRLFLLFKLVKEVLDLLLDLDHAFLGLRKCLFKLSNLQFVSLDALSVIAATCSRCAAHVG